MKEISERIKESHLISVIIPAFNEEKTIEEVMGRLIAVGDKLHLEIIVIDDGSTDRTGEIVRAFPSVTLVSHSKNMGKGKAIVSGLTRSHGQIILIQDADGEYAPEEIPSLVLPIMQDRVDVVFGSRFIGQHDGMSVSHKIGNKILSVAASALFGEKITDVMTGHKAFSRKAIEAIDLAANGFEVEVEMTGKLLRKRLRLCEVPISYNKRRHGKSKIRYRDGFNSFRRLISLRFYS